MEQLATVDHDSPIYRAKGHAGIFYSQSWALAHMLMLGEAYRPKAGELVRQVAFADVPTAKAFQNVYGKTLFQVQKDLESYLSANSIRIMLFDYKPEKPPQPDVRAASRFESELAIARLLSHEQGARDADEIFERLEETLQICLQMWSDDDGPYTGRHYSLEATLCRPEPVSSPRPRIMIGGSGERKTLRLVAQYADACNIFGGPAEVAHKLDVLRRHCDDVGRDVAEIEVTAMAREVIGEGATRDDVLRGAEAMAAVGVDTIVTNAVGDDPGGWLESTFGPAMDDLAAITPTRA